MIGEFIIRNMETGQTINFGQEIGYDCIYNDGDINWGTVSAKHNTFDFLDQVGLSISSTKINDRDVTINSYVYYVPTKEEIEKNKNNIDKYIYDKILEKKKELNRIVNPSQYLKIIVGDYYLIGKPTKSIKWATTYKENNDKFCKFQIEVYCNNPMFRREEQKVVLSGSLPGFKFPLVIPKKGIIFGERRNYQTFGVLNSGDVKTGAVFRIYSNGTVKGIKVENPITGEFFRINKTLQAGEEIIVNTDASSARSIIGYLNNQEINYFKYWDYEGKWIQFPVGQSYINYSLEQGSPQLIDLSLTLTPARYSVEEE